MKKNSACVWYYLSSVTPQLFRSIVEIFTRYKKIVSLSLRACDLTFR